MKDRFSISSEIAIGTQAPNPSSAIVSNQDFDSHQRSCTAVAVVDLLRSAGLECHLVGFGSDDSAQAPESADESPPRKTAKAPLQ